MEYYVYLIIVFAVVLKLGFYLCWYQSRRQSGSVTQVRVVMPDGSIRTMTVRGQVRNGQLPPGSDNTIYQYDNPALSADNVIRSSSTTTSTIVHTPTSFPQAPPLYTGAPPENKTVPDDLPPAYAELYNAGVLTTDSTGTYLTTNTNDGANIAGQSSTLQTSYGMSMPPPYSPSGLTPPPPTVNTSTAEMAPPTAPPPPQQLETAAGTDTATTTAASPQQ